MIGLTTIETVEKIETTDKVPYYRIGFKEPSVIGLMRSHTVPVLHDKVVYLQNGTEVEIFSPLNGDPFVEHKEIKIPESFRKMGVTGVVYEFDHINLPPLPTVQEILKAYRVYPKGGTLKSFSVPQSSTTKAVSGGPEKTWIGLEGKTHIWKDDFSKSPAPLRFFEDVFVKGLFLSPLDIAQNKVMDGKPLLAHGLHNGPVVYTYVPNGRIISFGYDPHVEGWDVFSAHGVANTDIDKILSSQCPNALAPLVKYTIKYPRVHIITKKLPCLVNSQPVFCVLGAYNAAKSIYYGPDFLRSTMALECGLDSASSANIVFANTIRAVNGTKRARKYYDQLIEHFGNEDFGKALDELEETYNDQIYPFITGLALSRQLSKERDNPGATLLVHPPMHKVATKDINVPGFSFVVTKSKYPFDIPDLDDNDPFKRRKK